jgi:hypothetical protein
LFRLKRKRPPKRRRSKSACHGRRSKL